MNTVGYLINRREGLEGNRGIYYNYILGSNGLFIEAENKLIEARIPLTICEVRGLAPVETKISFTYGSIPQRFFDLSLNMFLADTSKEHYVAIIGDAGYRFYIPEQDKGLGGVSYQVGDRIMLDMHSHGVGGAWFSGTDNQDETGLKLYGVIGHLDKTPMVKLRLGVYGYFMPLSWGEVFDGSLTGAVEYEEKEVIAEDELQSESIEPSGRFQDPCRWLRWNW